MRISTGMKIGSVAVTAAAGLGAVGLFSQVGNKQNSTLAQTSDLIAGMGAATLATLGAAVTYLSFKHGQAYDDAHDVVKHIPDWRRNPEAVKTYIRKLGKYLQKEYGSDIAKTAEEFMAHIESVLPKAEHDAKPSAPPLPKTMPLHPV